MTATKDFLAEPIAWSKTSDPFHPWEAQVGDQKLKLRLNDFPDEPMYTLIVDDEVICSFDNWPKSWQR